MATAAASTAVDFQLSHQQQFALEIMTYDTLNTSTVVEVRCLFCVHAQPPPQSVQTWHIFVPVLYQRHHEMQHARDWARYQACSPAEKVAFFEKKSVTPAMSGQGVNAGAGGATVAGRGAGASDAVVVVKRGRGRPRKDAAPVAPVVVKEKKPRGRPRKDGMAFQWSDAMAQRLVQLRSETFANWFASESRAMKHDGWKLITSTLKEEFGVVADTEQCKNKLRLLKLQSEKRSGAEHEPSSISVISSSGNLDSAVNAIIGQAAATGTASLAARQSRHSSWPQPSENEAAPVETAASAVVAEKSVVATNAASAPNIPVKRGRGRPRRDSYSLTCPATTTTNIAPPPQKKQRMELENVLSNGNALEGRGSNRISGDANTMLLQRILRATEEQKDALAAQEAATKAQTASIQELLAFLKTRPGM